MSSQIVIAIVLSGIGSAVTFGICGYIRAAIIAGIVGAILAGISFWWIGTEITDSQTVLTVSWVLVAVWSVSALYLNWFTDYKRAYQAWALPAAVLFAVFMTTCN